MYAVTKVGGMRGWYDQPGEFIPADQHFLRKLCQWPENLIAANSIPDFLEHLARGDVVVRLVLPDVPAP